MNVRMAAMAGLGAAVLLTSGCGSGPSGSADGNAAAGATTGAAPAATITTAAGGRPPDTAAGPSCPTPAMMGPPLGMTLKDPRVSRFSDYVVVCSYDGKLTDGSSGVIMLRLETGYTAAKFAEAKPRYDPGVPLVDQPGLGDEAFSFTQAGLGHELNTLVVRIGTVSVFLGGPATLDQEKALLKILFPG